jgi:predicted nucleic acid-binding protein
MNSLSLPDVNVWLALTPAEAWQTYDLLFEDERIGLLPKPAGLEGEFRQLSMMKEASPKVWTDAYLIAFASCQGGQLVTFDRALENRDVNCLILQ